MLKTNILNKLNEQINWEFYSSNLYLQMASWSECHGHKGSAILLRDHAFEEMQHMYKLFDYVNKSGGMACLGTIKEPPTNYESVVDIFQKIYRHECFVTEAITNLVMLADKENDIETLHLLKWFVLEQFEEEAFFTKILGLLEPYIQNKAELEDIDKIIGLMGKDRKIISTRKPHMIYIHESDKAEVILSV